MFRKHSFRLNSTFMAGVAMLVLLNGCSWLKFKKDMPDMPVQANIPPAGEHRRRPIANPPVRQPTVQQYYGGPQGQVPMGMPPQGQNPGQMPQAYPGMPQMPQGGYPMPPLGQNPAYPGGAPMAPANNAQPFGYPGGGAMPDLRMPSPNMPSPNINGGAAYEKLKDGVYSIPQTPEGKEFVRDMFKGDTSGIGGAFKASNPFSFKKYKLVVDFEPMSYSYKVEVPSKTAISSWQVAEGIREGYPLLENVPVRPERFEKKETMDQIMQHLQEKAESIDALRSKVIEGAVQSDQRQSVDQLVEQEEQKQVHSEQVNAGNDQVEQIEQEVDSLVEATPVEIEEAVEESLPVVSDELEHMEQEILQEVEREL